MKMCPVCRGEQYQFIHRYGSKDYFMHRCPIAHAYVCWDGKYVFYLEYGEIEQNPPTREAGE